MKRRAPAVTVRVDLRSPRESMGYTIRIGPGALDCLPAIISGQGGPTRLHVVSDSRVWPAWGRRLSGVLEGMGIPWSRTIVGAGETSKCAVRLEGLWRDLVLSGCDRRSCVVAFGGGVVGDLAGFAAASVLRGIPFIQVPTTLLSMVDASVGGKTGINLPEGKNLVGAFHQPRAVVMDLDLLATLPPREMRSGWAEVVKTAAIRDPVLFRFLEKSLEGLAAGEPALLRKAIAACCRIKAGVVERDEKEGGLRMILNFGHTLAHAIEAVRGYGRLSHGEAVAVGMVFAARLGEGLGRTEAGTADRLEELLRRFGLPVSPGKGPVGPLLAAMERDKKRTAHALRWVLLPRIGAAKVCDDIPPGVVRKALERFAGK